MAKPNLNKIFSTDNQLFEDLEIYQEFCQDFGYKFNEADLYNMRAYPFQQFSKALAGKFAKDQWAQDAARFAR